MPEEITLMMSPESSTFGLGDIFTQWAFSRRGGSNKSKLHYGNCKIKCFLELTQDISMSMLL